MNHELLCFHATEIPSQPEPPSWIMFAPAGESEISARLGGKVRTLKVRVDEKTAQVLQRDLAARFLTADPQPFFDFHHESRDASGYPLEFRWRDPGEDVRGGVFARVAWTDDGARAVTAAAGRKARIRYFSPRVNYDEATQRITGLMPAETGNAAGGLVSDPAFTKISPLTAGKAAAQAADHETQNDTEPMKKEMLAALAAAGLLTEAEAAQPNAHELLASRVNEIRKTPVVVTDDSKVTELTAGLAAAQQELTAMKARGADRFVSELVASGKIPAKAEATKTMWRDSFLSDAAKAEKAAGELTAAKALHPVALTDDADLAAGVAKVDGKKVAAKAAELMASKSFQNYDAAWDAAVELCKA